MTELLLRLFVKNYQDTGNPAVHSAVGILAGVTGIVCNCLLFLGKLAILILCLLGSVILCRPFCKYLCPLGAFYALFSRISLVRMSLDESRCTHCGQCERACRMDVPVQTQINHAECIRCGDCARACPHGCIHCGLRSPRS